MPTLAQIQAQPDTDLTRVERNRVHEVLGVPLSSASDEYVKAEARFEYFKTAAPDLNRAVRAYLASYDKVGDGMSRIEGGARGIKAALADDRARLALGLRTLVFPPTGVQPLDDEPQPRIGGSAGGGVTIHQVPVRYSNDSCSAENEYGLSDD